MAERLKDLFFTKTSLNQLADSLQKNYPVFDQAKFFGLIYSPIWDSLELMDRMRHTSACMHDCLPAEYPAALVILKKTILDLDGFEKLSFPDYVEKYGMDDWDLSLPALGYFTKFTTSEFAVRPYLAQDAPRVLEHMYRWADDPDENVRRCASEGCRPRLPWGMRLQNFVKDPSPILPILEKLKGDVSETVRRSVANNLNDISKDHPKLVMDIAERWFGNSEKTDWIVKHACRGLLKAGNPRAMRLFGFCDPANIRIEQLRIEPLFVKIGNKADLIFNLNNQEKGEAKVRLEYICYYARPQGKPASKVFQISEKCYAPGVHQIRKSHSFADQSTRKHFPGEHRIVVVVNGMEKGSLELDLISS